jgi:hypothetical protein
MANEDRCRCGLLFCGDMTAEELYPVTAISVVSRTDSLQVGLHETCNIDGGSQNECAGLSARWSELDRSVVNIVGTGGVGSFRVRR